MADRFFLPELQRDSQELPLPPEECHHLLAVARHKVGDEVEVFNGRGLRALATIIHARKREAVVRINETTAVPRDKSVTLATPLPKGDRADWLIEKCTELGVDTFVPLSTDRSVTHPRDTKLARAERRVIEACKQCRRDHLMTLKPLTAWREFASTLDPPGWMCDPTGELLAGEDPPPSSVAVGPEGGWTPEELSHGRQSGWKIVRIPGPILRIETASLAGVVLALHRPTG